MSEALFLKEMENYKIDEEEKVFSIVDEYQRIVLESLFTSFGLDMLLVKDRHGGDVDTINNVRKIGIDEKMEYKNEENKIAYENRGEYNSSEYHSHKNYREKNREISKAKKEGKLVDGYTGKKIGANEKSDLDHIKSAKEIHDDRGRVLAGVNGSDLANSKENLVATTPNINRSKKADTMEEHIKKNSSKYTEKEKKEMLKQDSKARKKLDRIIARKYYTSENFLKDTAYAAGELGIRMGVRQILGLMLTEVWISVRKEFKNFGENIGIIEIFQKLKSAINKSFEVIKEKYKEYLKKFIEAGLSGIFSSISTTVINIFSTTIKNLIKCIRELWVGIVKAFNILFVNPENYTTEEQVKEISKVIITTVSVLIGTLVKETTEKFFVGIPFGLSEIIPTFIGTLVTGLMSCTLIYILEKSDLVKKMIAFFSKIVATLTGSIDKVKEEIIKNNERLTAYAAELINENTERFIQEMNNFSTYVKEINVNDDISVLNQKLKQTLTNMNVKLAYKGNFEEFMLNKNNRLVFD